jgi:hypothetical protein
MPVGGGPTGRFAAAHRLALEVLEVAESLIGTGIVRPRNVIRIIGRNLTSPPISRLHFAA